MSNEQDRQISALKKKNKCYCAALIVLAVFISSCWIAYFYGRKAGKYDIIHNPYPLIDPSRTFIPQSDFITNIQPLRDYLETVHVREGDNISIYYEQLNSGANISVNKEKRFLIASLAKLPLAIVALKRVEKGTWKWETDFKVEENDIDAGSGELYKNQTRDHYTFKELFEALLVDSDNTAQNIFLRNLTEQDYQYLIDDIGLEELFDVNFQASAKEYSRLLRSLYTSSYLKREYSQKILELMSKAKFNIFLSQGLPEGVKFSHKYGENTDFHIFADSGIVYDDGHPYMLTVFYKGASGTVEEEKRASDLMKQISQKAYEIK